MKPTKKKNNQKPKLNVTVHEEQRNKLEQMASIEKRSVSDLIEVMADERWERLVGQQGIAYARTVAEAMNLKLDMDTPADREKLRRAILDLVAERKMRKQNGMVEVLSLSFCQAFLQCDSPRAVNDTLQWLQRRPLRFPDFRQSPRASLGYCVAGPNRHTRVAMLAAQFYSRACVHRTRSRMRAASKTASAAFSPNSKKSQGPVVALARIATR